MAKSFMMQLLLVVAALLHVAPLHCDGAGKTVVISKLGIDNEAACSPSSRVTHSDNCSNLTMALEGVVSNTTIAIERGNYTLRCSAHHKFNQIKNVTISGLAAASEVMVNCSEGAGLTFLQATTVNIFNVSFYGCGYKHVSNSIVKKDKFAEYNVALFFQMCRDVTLNRVSVSYSKGIAVQFFATIGNNEIAWSNFTNNNRTHQTVGGGVYIEFPYCLPGNYNDCTENTSTPEGFISGGKFRISYSNFFYNDARPHRNQSRVFMVPHLRDHISFGRGGGLSVFFKGNSNNSSVIVSHSNFSGNRAIYGGGAFVDFQDYCHDNEINIIESCLFEGNIAKEQGGGMRFNFVSSITRNNSGLKGSDMNSNRILIDNIKVHENEAASGGGLFFASVRENSSLPTNILNISFGNWTGNIAPVGSAISMICWHDVTHNGAIIEPVIQECSFHANRPNRLTTRSIHNEQSSVGIGAVYLDSIPLTFEGRANFTSNQHTAIVCVNTGIHFQNHAEYRFFKNSAYQGGAIALLGNAYFMVNDGTKLEFINNTAYFLGGAIYATSLTGRNSISSGNCFIRYYDILKDPNKWNARFKFINNTVMGKSNAIYTSSPQPCLWERAFGQPQDDQGMSEVFCWNNDTSKKIWDYGNNTCGDERMSAPSKFEKSENQTVDINILDVIPGRWKKFNLTILDDFSNDVTNYTVFTAQSLSPNNVTVSDHSHYLGQRTILLHQPNQNVTNGTVVLQTINTPNPIEAILNISFMECPPGFELSQGQCMCVASTKYNFLLKCDTNITSAHSDIDRGYWIGPSPYDNKTIMAICEFCYYDNDTITVKNFTEVQQKLCHNVKRNGTLCSKCMDHYCLAINSESYDCIKYDDSISIPFRVLLFILYKLLFSLLLLWLVYRFGIKIASGKYNAPVFFAQMVTTVTTMDLDGALWYPPALKKVYYILYDTLNLELRLPDYFRFCLHPQLEVSMMIALNYCVALLPIMLVITMAIVYNCHDMGKKVWCCYFKDDYNQTHRRSGCKKVYYYINRFLFSNNREYLVSAVASFFVLSYMKIAVTTCMLITPVRLVNGEGRVLYMDGSKRYPQDIIHYLILAFVFCVYLILAPISLLILRYGDPKTSEGFLYHLLKGLQENFKSLPSGDQSQRNLTCCKGKVKHRNVHRTGMWRTATFNTETELCSVDFKCCFGSSCFCSCSAHDFRWVSGAYFVLRILMLISYIALPTDMIQLVCQFFICCAAAAFFIVFRPYGYNHKEQDEYQQKKQQELTDTSAVQGYAPVFMMPNSPSERYNRLDAAVFLALAVVIAVCIYRSYLITIGKAVGSVSGLSALTLQSVLLFVPAAWFGVHILFDLKERCSGFKKWVKDVQQKRYREGNYEPVP